MNGMGTLYIDRREVDLRQEGPRLVVYEAGARTGAIPVSHLERVVVYRRAVVDTAVLGALAEGGVGFVVVNQRRPERTVHLIGRSHNDVGRRLAQFARFREEDWRLGWSVRLIAHKLRAQRRVLLRALAERPDARRALTAAARALEERLASLRAPGEGLTRGAVRGIEGAGAAAYFRGFTALFPDSLGFKGRNRRPPRDPVNACLSLGYTLLHAEAVVAAHAAGLEPLLGFYHEPAFGRDSLAADLIEPLRPKVDVWVWGLFRRRDLRAESFRQDRGACLLDKEGREVFYRQWEPAARPLRRALRRHANLLARALAHEGEAFLVEEEDDEA
jgi:CRISPR-associated protein Cas1